MDHEDHEGHEGQEGTVTLDAAEDRRWNTFVSLVRFVVRPVGFPAGGAT